MAGSWSVEQDGDGAPVVHRVDRGRVVATLTGAAAQRWIDREQSRRRAVLRRVGQRLLMPLGLLALPYLLVQNVRWRAWRRRCDRDPALQCEHGTPQYRGCPSCTD